LLAMSSYAFLTSSFMRWLSIEGVILGRE
jgi:hypothetical protein